MLKPNFAEINCVHYLRNTLKLKTRHKRFTSPSGMREFENPAYDFKIQPPTFAEITKFIMKMKFSASPRPLDQISVITFKKCPVLTSRLKNILQTAQTVNTLHDVWNSGVTVLEHKKGIAANPENFRPITLQPVLSKVFTSIFRNRLFNFSSKNKYIETNRQKGFWERYFLIRKLKRK